LEYWSCSLFPTAIGCKLVLEEETLLFSKDSILEALTQYSALEIDEIRRYKKLDLVGDETTPLLGLLTINH
jgi:hypothetical protein